MRSWNDDVQVHKEPIDKVPNALSNRSNIEIEIYGMEGIPAEDVKEHERQKQGNSKGSYYVHASSSLPSNRCNVNIMLVLNLSSKFIKFGVAKFDR